MLHRQGRERTTTSHPLGPSSALCLAADDGSAMGIGSLRVLVHHLVPDLLLGDCSSAPLVVALLKNWGAFCHDIPPALFPFISHPFDCCSFLLMYLHGERLPLGPLS
jgi:hypothetical protein